jgi:tetratricopeptide (TPR) repeat protein
MAAAQETRLSEPDQMRLRALQLIVSREYDRATPLLGTLENAADEREKPAAALESGWLAEKREDTAAAAAAYERALKLNPGYAAAKLRLGFIQQRLGKTEEALNSFKEAENLYNAASDLEGVAETLYQRAMLLNRRSHAAEAIKWVEKALAVAHAAENRYQEIRLQLLQSAVVRNLGQHARARELAEKAIAAAEMEKMDDLATSGLITLGNALRSIGNYESAEKNFLNALDIAQRGKVPKYEALASISLGALAEQKNQPDEARRFVEAAMLFYRKGGYRRELVQAMTILGGALHLLGDFDQSIAILRKALPEAVQIQDSVTELRIRERLGETLQDQGDWPEALQEFDRAASLSGTGLQIEYARLHCAGLCWRLGRRQDAERSLSAIEQVLQKKEDPESLSMLRLRQAEMAYAEGNFDKAKEHARMAIAAVPAAGDQVEPEAKLMEALASIRSGRRSEGIHSALQLVEEYEKLKLIGNAASARLSIAEALAATNSRDLARTLALRALDFFQQRKIWESVWRNHLVAARVSHGSDEAEAHKTSALSALAQLRKLWPAASVDSYMQRPDIKLLAGGVRV